MCQWDSERGREGVRESKGKRRRKEEEGKRREPMGILFHSLDERRDGMLRR